MVEDRLSRAIVSFWRENFVHGPTLGAWSHLRVNRDSWPQQQVPPKVTLRNCLNMPLLVEAET